MLELVNDSPFTAGIYSGHSPERHFQHTLVIKASYQFDLNGSLTWLETQPDIVLADKHHDDPASSSLVEASEIAPFKQGAEFYLFGTAHAAAATQTSMIASIVLRREQQGQQQCHKQLVVIGDHKWKKGWFGTRRGPIKPLGSLPLRYEYAYGGRHNASAQQEERNPAGRGFNPPWKGLSDPRAPRIEYRGQLALHPGKRVAPAGFGPLPVFWQPRRERFGTPDTDPLNGSGCGWGPDAKANLHNVAPDDQQWPAPFTGGETLTLEGFFANHSKPVVLTLPALNPAVYMLESNQPGSRPQRQRITVDTLVIDTDTRQLSLIGRTGIVRSPLASSAHIYLPDPDKSKEAQE